MITLHVKRRYGRLLQTFAGCVDNFQKQAVCPSINVLERKAGPRALTHGFAVHEQSELLIGEQRWKDADGNGDMTAVFADGGIVGGADDTKG